MQRRLPFALYDAFAAGPFGGATAGIVADAGDLSATTMQRIAREVAAPATAFLLGVEPDLIEVRFFSTLTEYGMCGHGTMALATYLVDTGQLGWGDSGEIATVLRTRDGDAPLAISRIDGSSSAAQRASRSRARFSCPQHPIEREQAVPVSRPRTPGCGRVRKAAGRFRRPRR
jgi:PhzF family phenazine biosynthesis protein